MPPFDAFDAWLQNTLLLSLRLGPAFAFAPPFTLVRAPAAFRMLLALALSGFVSQALPFGPAVATPVAAFGELFLGATYVLVLQAAYGAVYVVGRVIDIQAGFGLAALLDPTTQGQTPLVGTIYAYAAGVVFFGMGGHLDLLRIIVASFEAAPLGQAAGAESLGPLAAYLGVVFSLAFGVGGGLILALMLMDAAIALLARTAPQLNVLVLGFQLKTALVLVGLPLTLGVSSAVLARLSVVALEALPRLAS